jgi:signal transduction histidine kinase
MFKTNTLKFFAVSSARFHGLGKRQFLCCLVVFLSTFLSIQTVFANDPAKPLPPALQTELESKSIWEILEIANQYSFKDMGIALSVTEFAFRKAQAAQSWRDVFNVHRAIGFIYEDNALHDKAVMAYEAALVVAENISVTGEYSARDSSLTTIYNDLAIANRKFGNYRAAYKYYDKSLEIARRTNDFEMLAGSYHGQGNLHREAGIYDKAIDFYLQSLQISEQRNSMLDVVSSHNDIAETYMKAKELDKALQHIEKSYQLVFQLKAKTPNDESVNAQVGNVLIRYGEILVARKDYEAALKKHEEAFAIYKAIGYKAYIARTILNIANVHLQTKRYRLAEQKFEECKEYEAQFQNNDRAELFFRMGELYRDLKKSDLAEKAFLKSLDIANEYDFKEVAQRANYQMFLLCFDKHENVSALRYLSVANGLNDSLFNVVKARRTAEIDLKFDTERREKEISEWQLQQNKIFLWGSVFTFIMVVLFLGYIINMRGKNYHALKMKSEEIEQQYRKLEESNEILSQFAYVAAHDLKEPLRSIGSYIGLIQMKYGKTLPEDGRNYMVFVNAGVKRMYSLLTDLLDFSQVISQQPGCEVIRPEDVLEDVKANLRNAIESKNAVVEYSANLPSVRMNRLHMLQLMQNLIGNALKFTTDTPLVKIDAKEENGNIILTVEDNGIGISKEYGAKIFVLFQQLNKKGQFEGTGIGLTICKNIVEKYNGRIWFDSEENMGTKFYISIPIAAVAA